MKVSGLLEVNKAIERVHRDMRREVSRATSRVTDALLETLQHRTSRPFQETISYVFEFPKEEWGPDAIGTFANRNASLDGTVWQGQVQQFPSGEHTLHDALRANVTIDADESIGEVGYPKSLSESAEQYISWVLFGTDLMQPRPFLQLAMSEQDKEFVTAIDVAVSSVLEHG
jgi:hypothetical protein